MVFALEDLLMFDRIVIGFLVLSVVEIVLVLYYFNMTRRFGEFEFRMLLAALPFSFREILSSVDETDKMILLVMESVFIISLVYAFLYFFSHEKSVEDLEGHNSPIPKNYWDNKIRKLKEQFHESPVRI